MPNPSHAGRLTDHPVASAIAGAVVGAVAAAVLAVTGLLPGTAAPATPPTSASAPPGSGGASGAFLAAWRAHLMASWSVDEIDARTTSSGAVVRFEIHRAQAPPDSIVIGNGTVAARRGSVEVACGPGTRGTELACRSAPAPFTWQQDVDQQVVALGAEVSGPRAVYNVTSTGEGCWTLSLKVAAIDVPVVLGRGATYCLDTRTWALRSSVIQRVGATDRVTTASSHAPATAADLALPAGVSLA